MGDYCRTECETKYEAMLAMPFRTFYTHGHAAEYFGRDARTIKRFEGVLYDISDDPMLSRRTRVIKCRVCSKECPSSKARAGYCPDCDGCTARGLRLREEYRGSGNPNYIDGGAKQSFRTTPEGKRWAKGVKARDGRCRLCGQENGLHAHHILPAALLPSLCLVEENGVALCRFHHIALHERGLDIRLLPELHRDEGDLVGRFLAHPDVLDLAEAPYKEYGLHDLLRLTPKNYVKAFAREHPDYDLAG